MLLIALSAFVVTQRAERRGTDYRAISA